MCDSCGCDHDHPATVRKVGRHHHGHEHRHGHEHEHEQGPGPGRTLVVEQAVLAGNDEMARQNRKQLEARGITALNLVSSPGAGKTTLLEQTLKTLKDEIPLAVIEGDQQTMNDAERIAALGVAAVQVNTGAGCHLDAAMVGRAMLELPLAPHSLLFIENVGNLVCPALFDLGEAMKVVILSVTEGEDKPQKYPYMFKAAQVAVLTKTDLLPHVDFNVARCKDLALRINPGLRFFELSARTGQGLGEWLDWLRGLRL